MHRRPFRAKGRSRSSLESFRGACERLNSEVWLRWEGLGGVFEGMRLCVRPQSFWRVEPSIPAYFWAGESSRGAGLSSAKLFLQPGEEKLLGDSCQREFLLDGGGVVRFVAPFREVLMRWGVSTGKSHSIPFRKFSTIFRRKGVDPLSEPPPSKGCLARLDRELSHAGPALEKYGSRVLLLRRSR